MSITHDQAAEALRDIAQVSERSRELRSYQEGSPHFLMWGMIWIVGYIATGLDPHYAGPAWLALSLVGLSGAVLIGRRFTRLAAVSPEELARRKRLGQRLGLSWIVLFVFWGSVFAIFRPHENNQFSAFPGILAGAIYAFVGVMWLPRYLVVGLALTALTLLGYFFLAPWFAYWMALVGGGGFLLTSLWLRKA